MRLHVSLGLVLLSCISLSSASHASHVIVPDDYASIQSAMDSAADTVLVRDGTYNENLVMNRSVSVIAYVNETDFGPQFASPVVDGFAVNLTAPTLRTAIQGLRMRGPASLMFMNGSISFESCRFDSGVVTNVSSGNNFLYFRGCTFLRQCALAVGSWELVNSALIGTGLVGSFEGYAIVRNNIVQGPAAAGISCSDYNGGFVIDGNTVVGTVDGIVVNGPQWAHLDNNEVRDCSGSAFRFFSSSHNPTYGGTFQGNRVASCGGRGFDLQGVTYAAVLGNTIDSVSSDGIYLGPGVASLIRENTIRHIGGFGIVGFGTATFALASNNHILSTGSDGIALTQAGAVDSNVVGRATGRGIYVGVSSFRPVRSNTIYECGGAGIEVAANLDSVDNNIAFENGGYGLVWTANNTPALGCNDWFGNVSGATSGIAPGPTDLSVNPQFCNLPADDAHLASTSPLANAAGCGLIGALGVGCSTPLSVEFSPASGEFNLSAEPNPSRGHVTFAARGLQGQATIEVFDLAGARRWQSTWLPGQSMLEWAATNSAGEPMAAGVYFARLTSGAVSRIARVVLVH